MFEIIICPVKRLYQYALDGDMSDVAVLAVSSYDIDSDRLTAFSRTLCLKFADITNPALSDAFNKTTAEKIAAYIKALPDCTDTLFVCCDSGESRSTAMSAAIMRYHGLDEMKIWKNPRYHPNTYVYSLLCDTFGLPVTEAELHAKKQTNEKAFSDAVAKNG